MNLNQWHCLYDKHWMLPCYFFHPPNYLGGTCKTAVNRPQTWGLEPYDQRLPVFCPNFQPCDSELYADVLPNLHQKKHPHTQQAKIHKCYPIPKISKDILSCESERGDFAWRYMKKHQLEDWKWWELIVQCFRMLHDTLPSTSTFIPCGAVLQRSRWRWQWPTVPQGFTMHMVA